MKKINAEDLAAFQARNCCGITMSVEESVEYMSDRHPNMLGDIRVRACAIALLHEVLRLRAEANR